MKYTAGGQTAELVIPEGVKHIGVSMSGGADSSLLCYLLAKQIKEQNLDVIIHPISAVFHVRPWSYDHARMAIGKIKTILNDKDMFGQHYKFNVNYDECQSDEEKEKHFAHVFAFLHGNGFVEHFYSGKTKNPTQDVMDKFYDQQPQLDRNDPTEENVQKGPYETVPWAMVDKRFIIGMYEQEGILNTLLPETRSCEGDEKITENFTTTCGQCWWCEERHWALQSIHE